MAAEIVMPRLSDSMEEGTVLRWLKSEGEEVAVGDELVEIETDKANMVYESDAAGTLVEIVADEGDTLGIGEVIARVGDASEANGAGKKKKGKERKSAGNGGKPEAETSSTSTATAAPAAEKAAASATQPEGDGRVKASPIARRIAAEKGVDLGALQGSGPGGRIVKADVEGAEAKPADAPAAGPPVAATLEKPETAKGEVSQQELTKLQQTVARRMAESKATAPHFYLSAEVDMTRAVEARVRMKAGTPEGEPVPSFNDMVVKACAIALREHPRANGAYRDGRLEMYTRINVGVAVAAQDALTVPTIFDADRKGLREIARQTRELAGKVRDATITPPELSGGTFTVSNLGMYGIDSFSAVINPPQAGILAVGAINERPVVHDGEIAKAQLMSVTLACDHRILYGADGAQFLARIRELLEEPANLAL
ncbi:MAG: 2-oxo acid dehydrogenase subunit E2 [Actinomycetota bacterium]|nr:2-oxo acid dehydrogenase subunit E2 [Actinomycetota bacterium]